MSTYKIDSDSRNTSATTAFAVSLVTNSTPLNKSITYDNDELTVASNYHYVDATVKAVECNGLLGLKHAFEHMDANTAFVPGFMHFDNKWCVDFELEWELSPVFFDEDKCCLDNFDYISNKPSLLCFAVDAMGETPETAWGKLCTIDPALNTVGHLVTHSSSSYIKSDVTGEFLTGADRFNFYVIARDGFDIQRYSLSFRTRSTIKGFDMFEHIEKNEYCQRPFVQKEFFNPNLFICESSADLGKGLSQELQPIQFYPGGLLDTNNFSDIGGVEFFIYLRSIKEATGQYPNLCPSTVRVNLVEELMLR